MRPSPSTPPPQSSRSGGGRPDRRSGDESHLARRRFDSRQRDARRQRALVSAWLRSLSREPRPPAA